MKRLLPLLLATLLLVACGPTPTPGPTQTLAPAPLGSHLLINQAYGLGNNTDGAISHSFVELYNPTHAPVTLDGLSLELAVANGSPATLALSGSVAAGCSYLVVATDCLSSSARYTIERYDAAWSGVTIHNKQFALALVGPSGVIDRVAVGSAEGAEGGFIDGISKQKTVRRRAFADTDDNSVDFEVLDYRVTGLNDGQVAQYRPRCAKDGVWGQNLTAGGQPLAFSHEGGLYTAPFTLTMTGGTTDALIYYTLDGSEPTPAKTRYQAPLSIADRTSQPNTLADLTATADGPAPLAAIFKGTVVKARVFTADGQPLSDTLTHSYFVSADILSRYRLPLVSLSTDADHLLNADTGIFVHYDESGAAWERPFTMEYYSADGALQFARQVGGRVNGNYTRRLTQKSLRLYADDAPFVYDFFNGSARDSDGKPITSFERLILRNGGNDYRGALLRDLYLQSLLTDPHCDRQAGSPCVVFLNGEFWGLYNMRERYDGEYIASHYGAGKNNVVMLTYHPLMTNEPQLAEGNAADLDYYYQTYQFFKEHAALDNLNDYQQALRYIDADSLMDAYIAGIYSVNGDWPANNTLFWRTRVPSGYDPDAPVGLDGRWRWALKDLDYSLGLPGSLGFDNAYTVNMMLSVSRPGTGEQAQWSTLFFRRLLTNPAFADRFVNRFCDLLNTDLLPSVATAALREQAALYQPTVDEQVARFQAIDSVDAWQSSVNDINTFVSRRPGYLLAQLRDHFRLIGTAPLVLENSGAKGVLMLNGMTLEPSKTPGVTSADHWRGTYFANTVQTLSASAKTGYAFDHFDVVDGNGNSYAVYANGAQINISPSGTTVTAVYRTESQPLALPEAKPVIDGACTISADDWRQYTLTSADPSDNTPVRWQVDNRSLADIDDTGLLRAKAAGSLTLTATRGGAVASKQVTIAPARPHPNYLFTSFVGEGSVTYTMSKRSATYTLTPASGYVLDSVRYNGLLLPTNNTIAITDATLGGTLAVVFVKADGQGGKVFTDIDGHAAKPDIQQLAAMGVLDFIDGNAFAPDQPVTRAEAVAMMTYCYAPDLSGYATSPFGDVSTAGSFSRAVAWAYEVNITAGGGEQTQKPTFNPDRTLTRQDLAAFLFRYARAIFADTTRRADLTAYPDFGELADYADSQMAWCFATGLLSDVDGKLLPKHTVTRAEVATALAIFMREVKAE